MFKDRYTGVSDKALPENQNKKVISDDAFALGEIIEEMIRKIEHARMSL